MSVFFDNYIEISPPLTTGWQTVDLTAHGVTANAVAIIRGFNSDGFTSRPSGARIFGSSDNRISVQYQVQHAVYVGCDINSKIDLYKSVAETRYYLCGYFLSSEANYFLTGINKTPALSDWQTITCSEVPDGTEFAIFEVARLYNNGINFRETSSTDNRMPIRNNGHSWYIIGLNDYKQCDIYQATVENSTVFLVGYINDGTSKINALNVSLSTVDSYVDINLIGDAPSNTVAAFVQVYKPTLSNSFDLRKNGLSQEFYGVGTGLPGVYTIPVDTNKVIEGKINDIAIDFFIIGYILNAITFEYIGTVNTIFLLNSISQYSHPNYNGNTLLDLSLQSSNQYSRPNYNGNTKLVLLPNSISEFLNISIPVIVIEGNTTLKLKFTSTENEGLGTIKPSFILNSLTERTDVFGTNDPNLTINLSYMQGDCRYDSLQIKDTTYSPRIITLSIVPTTFELSPNIFVSCKPLIEWYESENFINDTIISGGEVTELQLIEQNDNTVLPNFEYMSYNFPFVGYGRPRKIFVKNISGFPLRYLHFGIDYPNIEVNDVDLVTSGTDTDIWGDTHSGWTSTGLIKDAITIDQQYDIIVEVEYKMFANLVLWEGQMCKISDRNYSVWCVIQNVTEVDTYTSLITLSILEPLRRGFDASKALLIGLKSISDVAIDEYVPIWLYNYIPFNASEVTNQKTRLFAHGVI